MSDLPLERSAGPIRVVVIEDDADIRGALELLISGTPGYTCGGAFGDCESALAALVPGGNGHPDDGAVPTPDPDDASGAAAARGRAKDLLDVVLMDIELPGIDGIEGVRRLRARFPDLDVIMLTVHEDDRSVFDSLCAGACGYLVKTTPAPRILAAIEEVHRGGAPMSPAIARMVAGSFQRGAESPLTARETEILQQLCAGKSYKMIANELYISQETVHSHLKNIYRKLEVNSKTEAMAKAYRERWV
ncbi:MAG: response regulator transcription factor [Candidatus Eisenbacteria bacterium]|uniref:Response regulator transcription factor n=1 Tax=Eiseniibacteriota bacterium TaxID=2212470 RepID=A0A956M3C7_UNCEI|nr:response regulator transcription factor [Candidatus Eisenbacteria bacterium]